jgi:hypothetical protein
MRTEPSDAPAPKFQNWTLKKQPDCEGDSPPTTIPLFVTKGRVDSSASSSAAGTVASASPLTPYGSVDIAEVEGTGAGASRSSGVTTGVARPSSSCMALESGDPIIPSRTIATIVREKVHPD